MFEKNEDYRKARKESKDRITKVIKVWSAREETLHDEGFQAGAEFGYNKANEWHYVKDGDLPKAYQKCYFIYSNYYNKDGTVDFSESSISVRTGLYAFYLDEEGEETTDTCFYDDINDDEISLSEVYAWKEIVLPELKEKSDDSDPTR